MKYRPSKKLCHLAGQLLADSLPCLFNDCAWDIIVPVPSSSESLNDRNFNQCAIFGYFIKKCLGGTHVLSLDALNHAKKNLPQASLSHKDRIKNVRNAFTANNSLVNGKRVLLVEDVITTGATITAASLALLQGGAMSIDVIAFARSHTWGEFRHEIYENMQRPYFLSS